MDFVIGKSSSLATNKPLTPSNGRDMASVSSVTMDNRHQRLFVADSIRINQHERRNRFLVFDVHPDRLANHPEAIAVIGQPDFETNRRGLGPATFGGAGRSAGPIFRDHLTSKPEFRPLQRKNDLPGKVETRACPHFFR